MIKNMEITVKIVSALQLISADLYFILIGIVKNDIPLGSVRSKSLYG